MNLHCLWAYTVRYMRIIQESPLSWFQELQRLRHSRNWSSDSEELQDRTVLVTEGKYPNFLPGREDVLQFNIVKNLGQERVNNFFFLEFLEVLLPYVFKMVDSSHIAAEVLGKLTQMIITLLRCIQLMKVQTTWRAQKFLSSSPNDLRCLIFFLSFM